MNRSLLCTLLVCAAGAVQAQPGPILIGEVAPLTGPAATVGTRLNKASKMWADDINAKGGINGRKIELVTCNDEARPEKAVACVRDMQEKGAVMVFGNSLTASLRAMQPLVKNGPLLLIPSPNVVPPADSYAFQVSPSDLHLTEAIGKAMKETAWTSSAWWRPPMRAAKSASRAQRRCSATRRWSCASRASIC